MVCERTVADLTNAEKQIQINKSTYTPIYFIDGKCVHGPDMGTMEEALQVLHSWKTTYNLEQPTAVEVTTTAIYE